MPYGCLFHLGSNFKWPDFKYANVRHTSLIRWHSYLGLWLGRSWYLFSVSEYFSGVCHKSVGDILDYYGVFKNCLNCFVYHSALELTGELPSTYIVLAGDFLEDFTVAPLMRWKGFSERNWGISRWCESTSLFYHPPLPFGRLLYISWSWWGYH